MRELRRAMPAPGAAARLRHARPPLQRCLAALGAPSSSATGSRLVRLFSRAHADTRAPPLFQRYWVPFVPPPAVRTSGPAAPILDALRSSDADACGALLDAPHVPHLPLPLWDALWTLLAQGPAPEPLHTLDARLERTLARLSRLRAIHADAYPGHPLPRLAVHRYIYLLLKHIERTQRRGGAVGAHHTAALACAATHAPGLDTELLGRAVFRLARVGDLDKAAPLLDAYAARSDHTGPGAAQPFVAVAEEAAARPAHLALAIRALSHASRLGLGVRGALVHHVLAAVDPALVRALAEGASLDTPGAVAAALRGLAATSRASLEYRAAVVLCRHGDPLPALALARRGAEHVPFDVFAAAISALTWTARDAAASSDAALAHGALGAALDTFDAMHGAPGTRGFDGDEQVVGELTRALEGVLRLVRGCAPRARQPQPVPAHVAQRLRAPPRDWHACLDAFTLRVIALLRTENALKPVHFAALLRENARAAHFYTCRALYEAVRLHTDALPWAGMAPVLAWLLREACRRGNASFAVALYDDCRAHGHTVPLRDALALVDAFMRRGAHAAAQRIIGDMHTWPEVRADELASGLVRLFLAHGHYDAAFAAAVRAYADMDAPDGAPPPLAAYAAVLHEAGTMPVREPARMRRIFAEFQLAYAHALALRLDIDARAARRAYRGMARAADAPEAGAILAEMRSVVGDEHTDVDVHASQQWVMQILPA